MPVWIVLFESYNSKSTFHFMKITDWNISKSIRNFLFNFLQLPFWKNRPRPCFLCYHVSFFLKHMKLTKNHTGLIGIALGSFRSQLGTDYFLEITFYSFAFYPYLKLLKLNWTSKQLFVKLTCTKTYPNINQIIPHYLPFPPT